jgi:hypothetical protein
MLLSITWELLGLVLEKFILEVLAQMYQTLSNFIQIGTVEMVSYMGA